MSFADLLFAYLISCFWQHNPNKSWTLLFLVQKSLVWSHVDVSSCQSAPCLISNSRFFPSLVTFLCLSQVEFGNPGGGAVGGGGCSCQSLATVVSKLQFLPTHMDGTSSASWNSQKEPGKCKSLGFASGFWPSPIPRNGRVMWKWKEEQTPGAASTRKPL